MHATSIKQLTEKARKLPGNIKTIQLACGHKGLYPSPIPKRGEPAYCRECGEFTTRAESGDHVSLRAWSLHIRGVKNDI